ncbi:MAG: tetratricopeptide repeat protein [Syntrophales bacterium]
MSDNILSSVPLPAWMGGGHTWESWQGFVSVKQVLYLPSFRFAISTLIIVCLLSLSYAPLFNNSSFVWDDLPNITENEPLKEGSVENILNYWKKPFLKLYIPLTYTVWSVLWSSVSHHLPQDSEYLVHARVFHLINIFLHLLNTVLIFLIVSSLVKDKFSAFLGALLFGIHPVQVETVAYITELRTLLACFFSLLSIQLYLIYQRLKTEEAKDNRLKNLYYSLSLACFFPALMAKPVSVVVPLFLVIINHFFFRIEYKANLRNIIPWVILSLLSMLVTIHVQSTELLPYISPVWLRPFVAFDAATFYLGKLFYPASLGIDYARTPEFVLSQWWGYLSWTVSLGLLVALWCLRRRCPLYLACFLIFLAGFLPVSGIVPFLFQRFSTVADRYLYFSMMGPALAVAIFIRRERRFFHLLPVFLILVMLMLTTFVQAKTWENGIKLYTHALKVNPGSYWARNNLANCIVKDDLIEAIFLYHEAITIRPDYRKALGNLAVTLLKVKKYYPLFRIEQLVEPEEDSMKKESAHLKAGITAFRANDGREALRQFGSVLVLNFLNHKGYNDLGVYFIWIGDYSEALWFFRTAITLLPENSEALNNLAIAHYYLGEKKDAMEYFDEALKMGKYREVIKSNRAKSLKGMDEVISTAGRNPVSFDYLLQE